MPNPSNLYAEKVFSEHPLALWALDDKVDYISLITENDRKISLWTSEDPESRTGIFGGTAQQIANTNTGIPEEQFSESAIIELTGELVPEGTLGLIECISPDAIGLGENINLLNLDNDLGTFSIGLYLYTNSLYMQKVEIGYEYFDAISRELVRRVKTFNTSIREKWIFLSETFDVPADQNTNIRLVVNVGYVHGGESESEYKFYVHGLSLGQWSEEFSSTSLGSTVSSLPSDIAISGATHSIAAPSYGLQNVTGHYLISPGTPGQDGLIKAKNSGIPMVYGASNVTMLFPNSNNPSLIVPGLGFLNENGKFKNYTAEFWLKASCDIVTEKRIFGPIASTDGLYVRGPFIILKIANSISEYYVGEWSRPMLIDICYTPTSANVLINGEEVISMSFETSSLDFPLKVNETGKDQDWLGFYAHDDVPTLEIDCIAIYPYQVSQIVAKRRWVYGQGVEFPENINTAYSGTSVFIDYPFANYANNYSYPDFGKWNQGIIDNLVVENNSLSLPKYPKPKAYFNNKTDTEWLSAISQIQNESKTLMSLRPESSWNSTHGYLLIDNLNIINSEVKAFYGVFKQKQQQQLKEILFTLEDSSTLNYFEISIEGSKIKYVLKYGNEEDTIYETTRQTIGEEFAIGLDINKFIEYFGENLPAFFGKKGSMKLYVGGNRSFENTFSGNIYTVGICNARNFSKISDNFSLRGLAIDETDVFGIDGGIPTTQYWLDTYDGMLPSTNSWNLSINPDSSPFSPSNISTASLHDFVASYTVILKEYFGEYRIDISADSYWEDYVPLTYFAKYVKDADNYSHYDLDFIQFNINYPAPSKFKEESFTGTWKYSELYEQYSIPVQRTYESLDNHLFTGYENYGDLKNKLFKTYKYDTSDSVVKTYISFQYLASGANQPYSSFVNTISPDKDGVVLPGAYVVGYDDDGNEIFDNFEDTRYEVVDNMILYLPKNIDFNEIALVTHIEITVDSIDTNPVIIKKMQYASQSLHDTMPNSVGTRFGTKLYPYRKTGVYYDHKGINPFSIYKGSTPYLYLTRNSGIQLRGSYDPLVNRGIQIPLNETKTDNFKIIAMQFAMRYDQDFFSYAPTEIMQIESKNSLIKLYLVANHPNGKRAKIYAINAKTGRLENGIAFYLNGKIVKEPNITVKEWGMLGISFSNSLNLNNYVGAIRVTGPILINTVSHYKSTNLQEVQQVTNRQWFKVKSFGLESFDWSYWDTSFIWNGVLVIASTSYYGVSPEDIYKTYIGTNKIIVDDEQSFRLGSYEYRVLSDTVWQSNITNAV